MIRMLHHMGNIFRDNISASGYRGLQLDRKRRKELQEWKIALGHRADDHEDPANYPKPAYYFQLLFQANYNKSDFPLGSHSCISRLFFQRQTILEGFAYALGHFVITMRVRIKGNGIYK